MLQNKTKKIHVKSGLLTILLMLPLNPSTSANAAEYSANAAEYEAVHSQIKLCVSCHGENGATLQPTFPILSGQHFYYLYVQLKDFKSGLRKNDVMGPIASQLDKSQMKLLAQYYSKQDWPDLGYRADSQVEMQGEKAAGAGQCVQCHLGGYEGDSRIPRLAGQHPEYLLKTMSDFKHKKRMNSAAKSSLFVSYSEDDIKSMSEYLAGK